MNIIYMILFVVYSILMWFSGHYTAKQKYERKIKRLERKVSASFKVGG